MNNLYRGLGPDPAPVSAGGDETEIVRSSWVSNQPTRLAARRLDHSPSSAAPAGSPADGVLALVGTLLVSDQLHLGLGLGNVGGAQALAHFDLGGGDGARRPAASSGARRRG